MKRISFRIVSALALPSVVALGCSSFGDTASSPADDGGTDAPTSKPASDSGSLDEASAEAGAVLECDDLDRSDVVEPRGFWAFGSPEPTNNPGLFVMSPGSIAIIADNSSASYLQSHRRTRANLVAFRAVVRADWGKGAWGGHLGWVRLFNIDASINVDGGEFAALEFNETQWRLAYRKFPGGTEETSLGPTLQPARVYAVEFEELFAVDGYIRISFDGVPFINLEHIQTAHNEAADWQLRVGPVGTVGTTPPLRTTFTQICASGTRVN